MKRPGGFDGGSDPDPSPDPEAGARAPASPKAPIALPDLLARRRRRDADRAAPAEGFVAGTETAPAEAAPAAPLGAGDDTGIATETAAVAEAGAGVDAVAETVPLEDLRPDAGLGARGADADGLALAPDAGELDAVPQADVREAKRRLREAEKSRRRRERGEQRRFTSHLRRRRRIWLVAGAAIAGLALFVAVGVFTPLMAVREVRIVGAEQMSTADLEAAMSRFEGVPLALVSDQDVHRALEPFPLIERYAIERIPPQTLVLRIEERDAVVAIERDGAFALYDPAGVLLGTAAERPEGVPLAAGAVLDPSSPAFQAAARIIRDLPEDVRTGLAGVQASTPQDVTLTLAGGTEVIWGGTEETQRKAVVVRSLIASLGFPAMIDVSAPDNPVFK